MQPTMKLQWARVETRYKSDPAIENGYDQKFVLQQWWSEGFKDPSGFGYIETGGEWRDIEIAEG